MLAIFVAMDPVEKVILNADLMEDVQDASRPGFIDAGPLGDLLHGELVVVAGLFRIGFLFGLIACLLHFLAGCRSWRRVDGRTDGSDDENGSQA